MSQMSESRLLAAIEQLYRVSDLQVPQAIEGCPCCIASRNIDALLSVPLREIPALKLWRYVSGAFHTVGGVQDFRYLLPRIFEVAATDGGNSNFPEIVLGKLALANWRTWAADEQAVVDEFVQAWFADALALDVHEGEVWESAESQSILCGAALAGMDLRPLLTQLHQPEARSVLNVLRTSARQGLSGFWDDVPAVRDTLEALLN